MARKAEDGPDRRGGEDSSERRGETIRAFMVAVLIALGVRTFVFEPFKIPSGSMIPTLLVGDYIVVNKFAYGVRMPFSGKVLIPVGTPTRGDVVVFRYPDDPSTDYIKRVMGIPGDKIQIEGDEIWINDRQLDHEPEPDYLDLDYRTMTRQAKQRYIERNTEGDAYTIIHDRQAPRGPGTQTWTVPEDGYFMMGDNRDSSRDSRRWKNTFVSTEQLKGRAFLIHWSWVIGDGSSGDNFIADMFQTLWKLVRFQVEEMRWERIGRSIDGVAD